MKELFGKGVSNGIGIGKILFFKNTLLDIPDYEVDNIESELDRYHHSMELAKTQLGKIYDDACKRVTKDESVIFKTHIMILEDSKFVGLVESAINKHKNAESAVYDASIKLVNMFKQIDDDYFRARCNDIIDASHILMQILQKKNEPTSTIDENDPVIVAATDLLPSDTISFKEDHLLGFVTNDGAQNSHTSILARTMGIPSVIQIHEPLAGFNGRMAIIDGMLGKIIIDPDVNTMTLYQGKRERYLKQQQRMKNQIGLPSRTKYGQYIRLSADIGRLEDITKAKANDSEGVGIYRSEMLFMSREKSPGENEQYDTYSTILRAFGDQDVVISTINGGSGKGMDYIDIPHEKNPALGFKGVRISLENPELLRTQLRALYRASVHGKLSILLPMISSMEEIEYVMREIIKVKHSLDLEGEKYSDDVHLGVLIETPAAALISDEICKKVDFITIGTDNLTQYTLAMDRDNQKLTDFFQPYHPGVRRLIKFCIDSAHKNNKKVGICGQLASDTAATLHFLTFKVDELIMIPSNILKIKAVVRETDADVIKKTREKYDLNSYFL